MSEQSYTIGELSKRSGVSVRRIRFYSDKGLLPPMTRTDSNYRVYTDADIARLDLIRALRTAGVSLDLTQKILSQRRSLTDVLRIRLETLEAEIAVQRRVAAVLRATLRHDEPTISDLRRLWTMTTLSNAQFRATIERFFDKVASGAQIDEAWKQQMIDSSTPDLPAEPTPTQIDAWNEIMTMVTDESFIAETRAGAATMWNDGFDPEAYAAASNATFAQVRAAIEKGEAPTSPTGRAIAQEWLEQSAKAMRRDPDADFLAWHFEQYRKHYGRSARYQTLLAILRGEDPQDAYGNEWRWINEAMRPPLTSN